MEHKAKRSFLKNKHLSTFTSLFTKSSRNLFHQTTIEEKIVIIASLIAAVCVFLPWFSIKDTTITGTNNLLYSIGYLILFSAIMGIFSVIWAMQGRPLPRILSSFALVHGIVGVQLLQLGAIAFTVIHSLDRIFIPTDEVATNPMIIMFCGVAILGAALFENVDNKRKSRKTIVSHVTDTHSDDTAKVLMGND